MLSALPSLPLSLLLPLLPLLLSLLLALLPLLLPLLPAFLLAIPAPVVPGSVATPAFSPAAATLVAATSVSSAHAFLLLRVLYTTA